MTTTTKSLDSSVLSTTEHPRQVLQCQPIQRSSLTAAHHRAQRRGAALGPVVEVDECSTLTAATAMRERKTTNANARGRDDDDEGGDDDVGEDDDDDGETDGEATGGAVALPAPHSASARIADH